MDAITKINITGATGEIVLDSNLDRKGYDQRHMVRFIIKNLLL